MNLDAHSLFSIEGKTAVLTGASGFLGGTFAETLLANGARLVAIGRSRTLAERAARWRERFGEERIQIYTVDMYDLSAFQQVLDNISLTERTEILINNAHELAPATGFNVPNGSLEDASFDHWMRNLTGGVYWAAMAVQRLGGGMKERGRGSIINISTMYALVAPRPQLYEGTSFLNPPAYSASKAALLSFTRYIASFWGRYGVRANAILPGPFSNTMDSGPNAVRADDPFLDKLRRNTCLGRLAQPTELAGALLFLASEASSFVTGQSLVVDGGWTVI